MNFPKTLLLAAILVAAPITSYSQTYTAQTYNCGRVTTPLYCYGIPLADSTGVVGSFWIDTYLTGYNAGRGFIAWNGVNLNEAVITGDTTLSIDPKTGQVTNLLVTFGGTRKSGAEYTGTANLTFTYYYSSGGGGRGGGGAGWRFICTGGTVVIE